MHDDMLHGKDARSRLRHSLADYPPDWFLWTTASPRPTARSLGFCGTVADINRFGARYRVAKSFAGVKFVGLGTSTTAGYFALFRTLLVYSAFESLLRLISLTPANCGSLLHPSLAADLASDLRKLDRGNQLFKFLRDETRHSTQRELDKYIAGYAFNPFSLPAALRHVFAHGTLTPNAAGIRPEVFVKVCARVCKLMFLVMDREFSLRVATQLKR